MKRKVLFLTVILISALALSHSMSGQVTGTFRGSWNFECPLAPEGFNTGIIDIQIDSTFTTFPGFKYKFPSTWLKIVGDTLIYNVDINGENVLYKLFTDDKKIVIGLVETPYGKSPLLLTGKKTKQNQED